MTVYVNNVIESVEHIKARSQWARAVKGYALEMLENVRTDRGDLPMGQVRIGTLINHIEGNPYAVTRAVLNTHCLDIDRLCHDVSWGGNFRIYNDELADTFYTPSVKRRATRVNGSINPNVSGRHLLDVQTRAIFQALLIIARHADKLTEFDQFIGRTV